MSGPLGWDDILSLQWTVRCVNSVTVVWQGCSTIWYSWPSKCLFLLNHCGPSTTPAFSRGNIKFKQSSAWYQAQYVLLSCISIFCSDWLDLNQSVAPPALSCHKEPAQGTQSISCFSLVLYGIRVASMHVKDLLFLLYTLLCHKEPPKGKKCSL